MRRRLQCTPAIRPGLSNGRRAHRLVRHKAEALSAARFRIRTPVKSECIRYVLIDTAADWQADVMVAGLQRRRGPLRFLPGGVAGFVARHANGSVQMVRLWGRRSADAERSIIPTSCPADRATPAGPRTRRSRTAASPFAAQTSTAAEILRQRHSRPVPAGIERVASLLLQPAMITTSGLGWLSTRQFHLAAFC